MDFSKILALRDRYRREYKHAGSDDTVKLILKAKVIAIGEVLDELGYTDDEEEGIDNVQQ